jgi:hypothetical protein
MKKSYAKSFLIAIFTLFVSISCDQQFDTPSRLTANNLLKDKDFLSFMSSVEEARQKILFRQKDLVIFNVTNGVSKPDFDGSLKNANTSLEKIGQWAKTKELAIENKNLIVQELGFKNSVEYDQIEQNIQKSREIVVAKYPELLTLSLETRKDLFLKVVEQWEKLPNAKTAFSENVICTNCFFNNCNSCGTGEGKSEIWEQSGGDKCTIWQQNCKKIRDGQLGEARAILLAEWVTAGITVYEIGTNVAAGSAPIIGPFSVYAGAGAGILSGLGVAAWATFIYYEKVKVIEGEYSNCLMDGPCA